MKTLLTSLNAKYVHSSLSIRYLKAYSENENIEIYDATINESPLDIAAEILRRKPDIAGFSCYIWNVEATLRVCRIIKEVNSDIVIVLGGPEVSFNGEEALGKYSCINYIISGEGEIGFNKLLRYLRGESVDLKDIDGLVYRDGNDRVKSNPPKLIQDLNVIPFPYKEGIPDRIIYYEAARGCPFCCKYCLSSTIKGLRYFNIERVKGELEAFITGGVSIVKFVDRTFNANRSFSMDIWKYLIEKGGDTTFHFEIAADLLDDESLELLCKAPAGLFQFEVGVQTTNPEILRNINRIMNFDKVRKNILRIREMGNIHCHLDLIAGLPGEGLESFRKSFDMCMEIRPEVLQLGFLKILKGSPMYFESEKYGIHYEAYPPYQVLFTGEVSFDEMTRLRELEEVFETFYNSGIFQITMSYLLEPADSAYDFFVDFTKFLKQEGFFRRKFDLKSKFKVLLDFSRKFGSEELLKDLLLHDFIINTRKSNIPDFLLKSSNINLKESVNERRDYLKETLGVKDFRHLFYYPVNVKIMNEGSRFIINRSEGIVVINLQSGAYIYI